MALPSPQYFSNSIVGMMQAGADVNIYRADTAPKYPVGQGFQRADGHIYRYASFDAAVTQGKVVAPVFANAGKTTTDNIVINPGSVISVPAEYPVLPCQVGSHYVQATIASITAGQYAGGYLTTEDGSGKGYIYRILTNTATGNPVSGDMRFQLYEPLQAVVSGNTDITIIPSMFNDVDVASTATNWGAAGVTMASIAAGGFGWICTRGITCVLQAGAWTGGDQLGLSTAVNGAASVLGELTTSVAAIVGVQILGYALQNGGDTEYGTMYLQLE